MQTYIEFIRSEYNRRVESSCVVMRKWCKNFEQFLPHYVSMHGFSVWLETYRDQSPSIALIDSMIENYFTYGDITASEVPTLLASIARQYNMELPAVAGILTSDYWVQKSIE